MNNRMIFPRGFNKKRLVIEFPPSEYCLYIPDEEKYGIKNGFYVNLDQFAQLMRANKNNPEVIHFLADMLA